VQFVTSLSHSKKPLSPLSLSLSLSLSQNWFLISNEFGRYSAVLMMVGLKRILLPSILEYHHITSFSNSFL
jgi:hypothetical protein